MPFNKCTTNTQPPSDHWCLNYVYCQTTCTPKLLDMYKYAQKASILTFTTTLVSNILPNMHVTDKNKRWPSRRFFAGVYEDILDANHVVVLNDVVLLRNVSSHAAGNPRPWTLTCYVCINNAGTEQRHRRMSETATSTTQRWCCNKTWIQVYNHQQFCQNTAPATYNLGFLGEFGGLLAVASHTGTLVWRWS